MPIRLILEHDGNAFGPAEIAILVAVYEDTLRTLGLDKGDDLATTDVAQRIIELAKQGGYDATRLREAVVSSFLKDPRYRRAAL